MGEVYRGRDTKLHRDVALKILPDELAYDPERLARFRREAQVLASLDHPNIAQIHAIESVGDVALAAPGSPPASIALVMEHVEGPTLAERRGNAWPGATSRARGGHELSRRACRAVSERDLRVPHRAAAESS
jgi:serine/threonine protein kinase